MSVPRERRCLSFSPLFHRLVRGMHVVEQRRVSVIQEHASASAAEVWRFHKEAPVLAQIDRAIENRDNNHDDDGDDTAGSSADGERSETNNGYFLLLHGNAILPETCRW